MNQDTIKSLLAEYLKLTNEVKELKDELGVAESRLEETPEYRDVSNIKSKVSDINAKVSDIRNTLTDIALDNYDTYKNKEIYPGIKTRVVPTLQILNMENIVCWAEKEAPFLVEKLVDLNKLKKLIFDLNIPTSNIPQNSYSVLNKVCVVIPSDFVLTEDQDERPREN